MIPPTPNLVYLHSGSKLDELCFMAENDPDSTRDYHAYMDQLKSEISKPLVPRMLENCFLEYYWQGDPDSPPYGNTLAPFDPAQITVIIPVTKKEFAIRGEGRRILLTGNAPYETNNWSYFISIPKHSQAPRSLRVLPFKTTPFENLKDLFEKSFEFFPNVDHSVRVTIYETSNIIITPSNSPAFF